MKILRKYIAFIICLVLSTIFMGCEKEETSIKNPSSPIVDNKTVSTEIITSLTETTVVSQTTFEETQQSEVDFSQMSEDELNKICEKAEITVESFFRKSLNDTEYDNENVLPVASSFSNYMNEKAKSQKSDGKYISGDYSVKEYRIVGNYLVVYIDVDVSFRYPGVSDDSGFGERNQLLIDNKLQIVDWYGNSSFDMEKRGFDMDLANQTQFMLNLQSSENEFSSDIVKFLSKEDAFEGIEPLIFGSDNWTLTAYDDYLFITHSFYPYLLRYNINENKIDTYMYLTKDFVLDICQDGEKAVAYIKNNPLNSTDDKNKVFIDFENQKLSLTTEETYDISSAVLDDTPQEKELECLTPYYNLALVITNIDENRIGVLVPNIEKSFE
ncbi:MAG: hypothetical protein LBM93_12450, partial [Oscillospiraceae bacterium]|nr:hypothetical protein [Oscillospiraceae bacterium]